MASKSLVHNQGEENSASAPLSLDPLAKGAPGVVSLEGLRYRVLRSGPAGGPHPKRSDNIIVQYEGRLENGTVFDSSVRDPGGKATFPLGRLVPGWVAALQLMRPGDQWEVFIPSYMAYGERGAGNIPADANLIFRITLLGINTGSAGSGPVSNK